MNPMLLALDPRASGGYHFIAFPRRQETARAQGGQGLKKGLIHLYCGDGKGKTTAALGLAVRYAGSGGKVVFVQFFKTMESSELNSLGLLPNIEVLRNSSRFSFYDEMTPAQIEAVTRENNTNLRLALKKVRAGACGMLVLDEIAGCYQYGLIDRGEVDRLLEDPRGVEIVLTGIHPPESFTAAADYITRMVCERHPYEKGIPARRGIEF